MRPIRCVVCAKAAQVASITHYLYIHDCEVNQTRWFTNGLLWSTDYKQITKVERHAKQTSVSTEQT